LFSPPPISERKAGFFKLGGKHSSWITVVRPTTPGCGRDLAESGALNPIVLKAKELRLRGGGREINLYRNMVRGGSGERREDSTGKPLIPGKINEHSVQPLKSRGVALVRP